MISLVPMSKVVVRGAVLFMIGFCVSVLAQAPAFDAVSIKANKNSFPVGGCRGIDTKVDETIPEGGGLGAAVGLQFSVSQPRLGRCNYNLSLKDLIAFAYGIAAHKRDERILGGPDWILDKYRIDAVAANPGSVREADLLRVTKCQPFSYLTGRFQTAYGSVAMKAFISRSTSASFDIQTK